MIKSLQDQFDKYLEAQGSTIIQDFFEGKIKSSELNAYIASQLGMSMQEVTAQKISESTNKIISAKVSEITMESTLRPLSMFMGPSPLTR